MTYSFPCTDLSLAGRMQGMKKGSGTRSGLLWEVERILNEMKQEELPDVLIMENVPQVHSDQNEQDFESWLSFLRSKGYKNFWKDLNAKDFGIPQNRERTFCVSFLSENDFTVFDFPEPVKLTKVMKDFLEETVEEKYYINNEKADKLIGQLKEEGKLKEITEKVTCATQDKWRGGVFLSYDDIKLKHLNKKISSTICSHVYKGFGGHGDNAIIEKI